MNYIPIMIIPKWSADFNISVQKNQKIRRKTMKARIKQELINTGFIQEGGNNDE